MNWNSEAHARIVARQWAKAKYPHLRAYADGEVPSLAILDDCKRALRESYRWRQCEDIRNSREHMRALISYLRTMFGVSNPPVR